MADNDDSYYGDASCRQERRRDVSAFRFLIATPAVGAFTMPARARLAFSSTAGSAAGDTLATIVGATTRTIKAKLLAADAKQIFDGADFSVVITPSTGIDVYVDQGLARWAKIAGG